MKTLKPIIKNNLKILFVGINPHPQSIKKSGYFTSNGSLWIQLQKSGLTEERIDDTKILKYNMGIMNICDRPTVHANELTNKEWERGVKRFKNYIKKYKSKNIVFIGKLPAQKYLGKININYGWQDETEDNIRFFVMIFPTYPCNLNKKIEVLKELRNNI